MSEQIQKIGLGSAQFGLPYGISNSSGKTTRSEVSKILGLAREKGIEILDTASAYGNAEHILGLHDLTPFKVVSKFMPPEDGKSISDLLNQSLQHLGLTSLYGYMAHRPLNLAENLHQWVELKKLKRSGKIDKIGVSLNTEEELDLLNEQGIEPDIIQVPFNYFDRRFEDSMISLRKKGCEIHSRSAFLQGLFFMDPKKLDHHFHEITPMLVDLQKNIKNLPAVLLKFVLNQPMIDAVIIGVENSRQLTQNLESVENDDFLPDFRTEIPLSILNPSNWPE